VAGGRVWPHCEWTGKSALTDVPNQADFELRSGVYGFFSHTSNDWVPLELTRRIDDQDVTERQIFEINGDLHLVHPDFPSGLFIDLSDDSQVRRICPNSFAELFLCRAKGTGREVVVKILRLWDPLSRDHRQLMGELQILHCSGPTV
jgi:hypothetical protein